MTTTSTVVYRDNQKPVDDQLSGSCEGRPLPTECKLKDDGESVLGQAAETANGATVCEAKLESCEEKLKTSVANAAQCEADLAKLKEGGGSVL